MFETRNSIDVSLFLPPVQTPLNSADEFQLFCIFFPLNVSNYLTEIFVPNDICRTPLNV